MRRIRKGRKGKGKRRIGKRGIGRKRRKNSFSVLDECHYAVIG